MTECEKALEEALSLVKIQQVPDECNFWMVRCKGGAFYDEYVRERFIAIGWNALRKKDFESEMTADQRKKVVEENYPEEKKPMGCATKCNRFISEMKTGDIVLVVGFRRTAFCMVGDYFESEDPSCTVQRELEVNAQIKAGLYKEEEIPCPYLKRRHITPLAQVDDDRLNPHLYRAITNRHSICSLEDYAQEILSSCFDLYAYKGNTVATFHIDKSDSVDGLCFAQFMLYTGKLLSGDGYIKYTTRANVNSPGEIVFTLEQFMQTSGDMLAFLEEFWLGFLMLYGALFGGEIEAAGIKVTIPSVRGMIKYFLERKHTREMERIEEEQGRKNIEKTEAETEKLKAEAKKLEAETAELKRKGEEIRLSPEQRKVSSEVQAALGTPFEQPLMIEGFSEQELRALQRAAIELQVRRPVMNTVSFPSQKTTPMENRTDDNTER